jgi:hypothetical protein
MPLFFSSGPDFSLPSLAHFQPILAEETKDLNSNQTKTNPNTIINLLSLLQHPFKPYNPTTPHVLHPPSLRPESNSNSTGGQVYAKFQPIVSCSFQHIVSCSEKA